MQRIIGISTGVLFKLGIPINTALELFVEMGCNGVELGYVDGSRITEQPLEQIDHSLLKNFSWVSVHAPAKNFQYGDNDLTKKFFTSLQTFNKSTPLNAVVFHPDAVGDISILESLSLPIGIENMDKRKQGFQTPEQLMSVFDKYPEWGLVLDVNHCYSLDPSMQLAEDLKTHFLPRIKQVHLSGYTELHDPLYNANQEIILDAVPEDVPIIIESTVLDSDDIKKEFEYITNYLNK